MDKKYLYMSISFILIIILGLSIYFYRNEGEIKININKEQNTNEPKEETPLSLLKEDPNLVKVDKPLDSSIQKKEVFSTWWTVNTYYSVDYKGYKYEGLSFEENNFIKVDENNKFFLTKEIEDSSGVKTKETYTVLFWDKIYETDWFNNYSIDKPEEYLKNNQQTEFLISGLLVSNPNNVNDKMLIVTKLYKTELRKTNWNLIPKMMDEIVDASSKYTWKELDNKIIEIKNRYWFKQ